MQEGEMIEEKEEVKFSKIARNVTFWPYFKETRGNATGPADS